MSGGSLNYIYHKLNNAADYIDDAEICDLLKDLAEVLHDYEWYDSGDYSRSTYEETLAAFKEKWFKSSREDRLKVYIKDYLKNLEEKIDELF